MSEQKELLQGIRQDVTRLLRHAVRDPTIPIEKGFLGSVVPLLFKHDSELSSSELVELWDAHNKLSYRLAPVTAESLEICDRLNGQGARPEERWYSRFILKGLNFFLWLLALVLLMVIAAQGYSVVLSNHAAEFASLDAEFKKALEEEKVMKQALPAANSTAAMDVLNSVHGKQSLLQTQMLLSGKNQCGLLYFMNEGTRLSCTAIQQQGLLPGESFPHGTFFRAAEPAPGAAGAQRPEKEQGGNSTSQSANRAVFPASPFDPTIYSAVQVVARSVQAYGVVLNSLVLPFLLGVLGAGAYMTRGILQHLDDLTYEGSWSGRYVMRFLMGGLLGVLGPFLYSSGKVNEMGLGLSLFAFLLGYSVELAFSLIDRFINYAREAIKAGAKTPPPKTGATLSTENVGNGAAPAAQGNIKAEAAPNDLTRLRGQFEQILSLGPILQAGVPPELFNAKLKPVMDKAQNLLHRLGSETDPAKVDSAVLADGLGLTTNRHPLTILLRSALASFTRVIGAGGTPDTPKNVVLSLFRGALAAFGLGTDVFERWQAYVLAQPYIVRRKAGIQPTPREAQDHLKSTGIFRRAFQGASETLALKILELAQTEQPSDELAANLWAKPELLGEGAGNLHEQFQGLEEWVKGWVEYRQALLCRTLQKDFPEDRFPGGDGSFPRVSEILALIQRLREDLASAGDLDILAHLAKGLMKASQESPNLDVEGLIRQLLPLAAGAEPGAA